MKLKILVIAVLAILCPCICQAAPGITVSATGVSILGTSTPISISVTLIDPNSTGNLHVVGTGVIPIMQASTVTPGTTAAIGPIYGNDVITDGYGNINATYYKVQVFTVTNGIIASTASLQNFYAFVGSGTIDLATATPLSPSYMTGTNGSVFAPALNTVAYVGGSLTPFWGGGDIGQQVNAAYAGLPASGGTIGILPQSAGSCYNYSTPIVFGTLNKPATLRGLAPSNSSTTISGTCLNFTPTTAGSVAITLDWTVPNPTAFQSNTALADFILYNNNCTSNFGCGSSAVGVLTGATNGGVFGARFSNFNVYGFGNGWRNAAGAAWGRVWDGGSIAFNTIGVQLSVGNEEDSFIGVKFVSNGIHIAEALTPAEVSVIGGSMDAAGTCGVTMANLTFLYAANVHWENNGVQNTQFVCGPSGSALTLTGGVISDDHNAGGPSPNTSNWFQFGHGTVSNVLVEGFNTNYTGGLIFDPLEYAAISGIAVNNSTVISDGILCPVPVRCSLSYSSPQQPAGISWNNVTTTNVLNQGCSPSGGCFAGISACVSNVKTITFGHTYNNLPSIQLTDETTAGGIRVTGKSTSQLIVACTGATDAFDWQVTGNPN